MELSRWYVYHHGGLLGGQFLQQLGHLGSEGSQPLLARDCDIGTHPAGSAGRAVQFVRPTGPPMPERADEPGPATLVDKGLTLQAGEVAKLTDFNGATGHHGKWDDPREGLDESFRAHDVGGISDDGAILTDQDLDSDCLVMQARALLAGIEAG
jgi:hypothetical protein